MSRYARRTDRNQETITLALRKAGALVHPISALGGGVPDLLVSVRGDIHLLEVKDGEAVPSRQRLTPMEDSWHRRWAGPRVHVVASAEEALRAVGLAS